MPIFGGVSSEALKLKNHVGWVDYNDLATQTVPIPLTVAGTVYDVPNDGEGDATKKGAKLKGHGEIWNAATGLFDFTSLRVYDFVLIRYDLITTTGNPNQSIFVDFKFGLGTPHENQISLNHTTYKTAAPHQIGETFKFYMGNDDIINSGAKITISSDDTGATLKVKGWVVTTFVLGF